MTDNMVLKEVKYIKLKTLEEAKNQMQIFQIF